jgi:acetolactate synthase small subunit
MKQTISILLHDRFNDAERVIGMFSGTGYKIEKMVLGRSGDENLSRLTVVTDPVGRNLENFLTRLRQQVRVSVVDCTEGDHLPSDLGQYSTIIK